MASRQLWEMQVQEKLHLSSNLRVLALAGALGDHIGEVWPSSWASLRPYACECQVELA